MSQGPAKEVWFRHLRSDYNQGKLTKAADPEYDGNHPDSFKAHYNADIQQYKAGLTPQGHSVVSRATYEKAEAMEAKYKRQTSDPDGLDTPLSAGAFEDGIARGVALRERSLQPDGSYHLPHAILLSPALRAQETFRAFAEGFPELKQAVIEGKIPVEIEDRVREKRFGEVNNFTDPSIYFALHPDELERRLRLGKDPEYEFRPRGGENIPDIINKRLKSLARDVKRRFSGKEVWVFSHHLTILAKMTREERLSEQQFIDLDHNNKPENGSMTVFEWDPTIGRRGRLALKEYNVDLLK